MADFRHAGSIDELFSRASSALGVTIVVHWDELAELSIQRTNRTTDLRLFATNGLGLLRTALRELGRGEIQTFAWYERGELHVSTRGRADRQQFVANFDVAPLLATLRGRPTCPDPNDHDAATEFVLDTVTWYAQFYSWLVNGGDGTADVAGTTLTVRNGRSAIQSVANLLNQLQAPCPPPEESARVAPHYLHDDTKLSRRVARRLAQTIDAPSFEDVTVGELLEWFSRRLDIATHVVWYPLESLSIERDQRITLPALPSVVAFAWLECALQQICADETRIGFSVQDGILCIAPQEWFDLQADNMLVADTTPLLRNYSSVTRAASPRQRRRALEQLTDELPLFVAFENWMINGGKGDIGGFVDRVLIRNSDHVIVRARALLAKIAAAQQASATGDFLVLRDWEDDPKQKWNARAIERLGRRAFPRVTGEMPLQQALANLAGEADVAIWMDAWDRDLSELGRDRLLRSRVRDAPAVLTFRERLDALLRQVPPLDRNPVIHIRGGVIFVSRELSARRLIFRAYPVGKLLRDAYGPSAWPTLSGSIASGRARDDANVVEVDPNNPHESIGEQIRDWLIELTGPSRWIEHGGRSAISMIGDVLLVTSDAWTHETIEAALRAAHAKLPVIPPPRRAGR
ncbi:MAG: hypothetical protein ACKVS9_12100 [Phycisphaerae bacterium]